jgi:hypothetical protein
MSEEICPKIYIGQDPDPEPDPDVFESRIRIRSEIVRIRNTDGTYIVEKQFTIAFIWTSNM